MIFPKLLVPVLGLTTYVSAAALESVRAEPIGKVEVFNTAHCTGTAIKTIDVLTREDCIQFGDSGFSSVKWTSYRDIDKSYSRKSSSKMLSSLPPYVLMVLGRRLQIFEIRS
jgi:hypothetical protein